MPLQDLDRDDVATLRVEIARLQSILQRLTTENADKTVARFVVSDYEAGLPVARSTLDAAQRALGLPAIDEEDD